MTPKQFQKSLDTIGWSKRSLAVKLGVNEMRPKRWASGVYPVPDEVAQWLTTLARVHAYNPPPRID